MTESPYIPGAGQPGNQAQPAQNEAATFSDARGRGAVDLSTMSSSGNAPGAGNTFVVDVNEQNFQEIVQLSAQVPVVFAMHAQYSPQSGQIADMMGRLVNSYVGRLMLAKANVDTFPQLTQAFGVQGVPAVVAVVKGQPVPLFNGAVSEPEAKRYLDELLKVAANNGVTGTLGDEDAAPQEAELPPLHQKAVDAIEQGDFATARSAYEQALKDQPADHDAKAGLAQVGLLERTTSMSAAEGEGIRTKAADEPDNVQAQLAAADLDMSGGHVEDALNRLVTFVANHPGSDPEISADRETARLRLLELFEVAGSGDSRVAAARQQLARALF